MKKLFIVFVVASALAACSKDKFETVPTVRIESFGPPEVNNQDYFRLVATVTDKEGDLQDSVVIYRNIFKIGDVEKDSVVANLKDLGMPSKTKFEIQVTFRYGSTEPQGQIIYQELRTDADRPMSIGLVVKDNAGHRSEYVESDKIILKKFP